VAGVGDRDQLAVAAQRLGAASQSGGEREVVGPQRQRKDVLAVQAPHGVVRELPGEARGPGRLVHRAEEGAQRLQGRGHVRSSRQSGVEALHGPQILEDQHPLGGVEADHTRADRARLERSRPLVVAGLEDDPLRGRLVLGEALELTPGLFHHDRGGRVAEAYPPDPVDVSITRRLDEHLLPRREDAELLQVAR
jgi:hypothetical protein